MKKLKIKKAVQKPVQNTEKQNDKKYFSDMGIGFRVVEMNY
jgi:hypothetical protein